MALVAQLVWIESGLLGPERSNLVDRASRLSNPAQAAYRSEKLMSGELGWLVVPREWEKEPGSLGQLNFSDLSQPLQARDQ